MLPAFIRPVAGGLLLALKVQPRASANKIGDLAGGELKVWVTAPPVDAAANEAVLRLLADKLECGRGGLELVRGRKARHKTVKVHGLPAVDVLERLGWRNTA